MSNSSDWADEAPTIGLFIVLLAGVISIPIIAANEEKTKQEAIKAGLVQDNEGHWVRHGYQRSTEGSYEILLQKPEIEE